MALGTTNISIPLVKNTLSESTDNILLLCQSTNINKWSRHKPVREAGFGTEPPTGAGVTGKFGFNLPTNWNYLTPRGGSWGGSPDEPGRLGDFRGYEHDKDIAGPVTWMTSSQVSVPATLTPTGSSNDGSWMFKMNTVSENIRITLADLGMTNYYFGIELVTPTNGVYYKTKNSTVADSDTLLILVTLNNPATPSFNDCPYGVGTFNWTAFISSSMHPTWTESVPSNMIHLPTGTFGSKTVINAGSFSVSHWLTISDDVISWEDDQQTSTAAVDVQVYGSRSNWSVLNAAPYALPSWITAKYFYSYVRELTESPVCSQGWYLRLYPNSANSSSSSRSGTVTIYDTGEYKSISVSQAGTTTTVAYVYFSSIPSGSVHANGTGSITVGTSSITYTVEMQDLDPENVTIYCLIKYTHLGTDYTCLRKSYSNISNGAAVITESGLDVGYTAANGDVYTVIFSLDVIGQQSWE